MSSFESQPQPAVQSGGRGEGTASPAPASAEPGKSTLPAAPGTDATPMDDKKSQKLQVETSVASPKDGSKDRKTVGLGELVYIQPEEAVAGTFTSTGGKGTQDGVMYNWTAPATAQTVTITFTPKDGTPSTVQVKVIEPTSVEFEDKEELSYGNVSAAGMKVKVVFLPLSVSFSALDWQEKDVAPSAVEGWFKKQPAAKLKHKKGPGGYLDAKNAATDKAEWASNVVVKEDSKLQWDIPQQYSVNGGAKVDVPNQPFTQLMTIDANGTTTVSKNGMSVTRAVPDKQ